MNLSFCRAQESDLPILISLLAEDKLGEQREEVDERSYSKYLKAFQEIHKDPNQYLMIVKLKNRIVGTCHLTLMPSLTFCGSKRMQIEAVRIDPQYRSQKIGESMIHEAIEYAKANQVVIIQLTTDNQRLDAIRFYEKMGFKSTHQGFKMHLL